jgi:hypothetical protein
MARNGVTGVTGVTIANKLLKNITILSVTSHW